jgi:hypothetical protein
MSKLATQDADREIGLDEWLGDWSRMMRECGIALLPVRYRCKSLAYLDADLVDYHNHIWYGSLKEHIKRERMESTKRFLGASQYPTP